MTARVDMKGVRGYEVANLAAYGWQWSEGSSLYQLVALRGVSGPPMLGVKTAQATEWTTARVHDKWTTDGTRQDFLRVVKDFLSDLTV